MTTPLRVTILGCGAAPGVPSIATGWGRCDPANPRNRRRRASILVSPAGPGDTPAPAPILVDTAPDLRDQLLDAGTNALSAVLYTHAHADHLHGLDDLREVNRAMGGPLDVYADAETLAVLEKRFHYAITPQPEGVRWIFKPLLVPHRIDGPFEVAGLPITPFAQDHKVMTTLGFRFGDGFAYSTDVVHLDDDAFAALAGVDTWVVGCIGWEPHPTHAHVERVLEWANRVGPRRLVLTHLGLGLDYDALVRVLPAGAEPAYDGMVLEVPSA
ncbi:MBL fold metallo-hydrolase [Roseospira goensis]|uniref:Phosphoribosyl 1,2-cyclic phosphate phosphodiesterase n=1 Tax=Roseospira goensis TaxID=391922 RepID=A0A7W6RX85_9PROT|nr:MBL fold metallo-hydrolase [Roseospira goensis]MBB4284741.1 phosphoribosyl 1,2-cyclic phosphate phosphodiesterase [Roseospira goensis]